MSAANPTPTDKTAAPASRTKGLRMFGSLVRFMFLTTSSVVFAFNLPELKAEPLNTATLDDFRWLVNAG